MAILSNCCSSSHAKSRAAASAHTDLCAASRPDEARFGSFGAELCTELCAELCAELSGSEPFRLPVPPRCADAAFDAPLAVAGCALAVAGCAVEVGLDVEMAAAVEVEEETLHAGRVVMVAWMPNAAAAEAAAATVDETRELAEQVAAEVDVAVAMAAAVT